MQNKEKVQGCEHERNEVSYPENVHAEGGTTPRSQNIVIMNQKTVETSTNEESSKYLHAAHHHIDPSIMQNKEPVQEYDCKRKEVSYP